MTENQNNNSAHRVIKSTRAIGLALAVLMLFSLVSAVNTFTVSSDAAEYTEPIMSIGIQYGSSAKGSFRTYSDSGYKLWSQLPDGERNATMIGAIEDKTVIVAPNANLAVSGTGFAASASNIAVGGYRLEVTDTYDSFVAASEVIDSVSASVESGGYQIFPAYINGKYRVRIGCFTSQSAAESAKSGVQTTVGKSVSVVAPDSGVVSVLTSDAKVKFEFGNGTTSYLGLSPIRSGDVYMRSDENYIYEGIFMYKRSDNLITVINMIGLETYIEGVLPYEISNSWHVEAQKAFAIAARSYAIGNKKKHYASYGFDLCNSTNCQVYRGAGNVNDKVKQAVAETSGQVMVHDGKPISVFYSSSTGGCTVSAKDCWGGTTAPYFVGISTPWERYADYSNGSWTSEVSPSELCTYLRGKGYTKLSGSIASIQVIKKADNSEYVKEIKFTDTAGVSVTVTNSDNVRTALSKYVKSANFVVGKGSVAYTVSKVTVSTEKLPYEVLDLSAFNIITSAGKTLIGLSNKPNVITGNGTYSLGSGNTYVITADSKDGGSVSDGKGYSVTYSNKTATASSSQNFVFAGKGWGHGVGLSQYGCKDLAEFGYSYDRILTSYVPSGQIKSITELS